MKLDADARSFDLFLMSASAYWRNNLPAAPGSKWIIVEAMHHEFRVILRTLTLANAVRRITPARLLVVTGTDADWHDALWDEFDAGRIRRLAEAFGASEVLDVHDLADRVVAAPAGEPFTFSAGGRACRLGAPAPWPPITPGVLDAYVDATACRLDLVPRLDGERRGGARYRRRRARAAAFAGIYDTLCRELAPIALVTSHVDYDQWGLAVEAAVRARVPVLHVQSTGSLKAYAHFPENAAGEMSYRAELTRQIGAYFDDHVWAGRDILGPSAELVAWRSRGNLGRPSWWRGGAEAACELRSSAERRQFREYTMERHGLDPARPVVTVYNHAISDALGTNRECFGSLAEWVEETARYAASMTGANWLFLDHPNQFRYDSTGHFESLAEEYAGHRHLRFLASTDLTKNAQWSLTDLAITVRGSVSNELPAFGTPVIQAGWSEWSACGLSTVVLDRDAYWKALGASIEALTRGEEVIAPEQVERARLWLWFYRSAADVPSPLVPAWDIRPEDDLMRALDINLRAVESDGDPVFAAALRMWSEREPFLTRFDLKARDALAGLVTRTRERPW
ncbi:MAG TPA: hypothetical protein VF069_17955 [Streptosporangiaceae bacterium]